MQLFLVSQRWLDSRIKYIRTKKLLTERKLLSPRMVKTGGDLCGDTDGQASGVREVRWRGQAFKLTPVIDSPCTRWCFAALPDFRADPKILEIWEFLVVLCT